MYEIDNNFCIRVPLIPLNEHYDKKNILDYCKKSFMESIAINSNSLFNTIDRETGDINNKEISVLKYIIRASTRTTPYGLNSFVSLGSFEEKDSGKNNVFSEKNLKKDLLLDYEWIVDFLLKIEAILGKKLRVTISNSYIKNDSLVLNKWVNCFHEEEVIKNKQVLINRKNPFNIIEKLLSHKLMSIEEIVYELGNEYKDIDQESIYFYIKELIKNGFLISDLHLSTIEERSIDNLINLLAKYNGLDYFIQKLSTIKEYIDKYNNTKIQGGTEQYLKIKAKLSELSNKENSVSVDLYNTENIHLDVQIKNDVVEFVNFLEQFDNGIYYLKDYYMKFIEKYNYDAVPIVEVLDDIVGIGMPIKNQNHINKFNQYIYKINKNTLDLSNIELHKKKEIDKLLPSDFEIAFSVYNQNGTYKYLTTPLIGSDSLFKSIGRFHKLRRKLNINKKEYDNVEICYFPKVPRISNVICCYSNSEYYLEYGSFSYVKDKKRLELSDIYLYPINGILKFININTGHIINFTVNNMTNINFAPDIIKGIQIIEQCSKKNIFSIYNQISNTFKNSEICPKILYKNFIIKSLELRLKKEDYSVNNISLFKQEFTKKLEDFNFSNKIYCGRNDNYLLLNVSENIDFEIIRQQLIANNTINIRESYFTGDNTIIKTVENSGAQYVNEVVFQIRDKQVYSPKYNLNYYIKEHDEEWISLKLYMPEDYMNYFIINYLDDFVNALSNKKNDLMSFYLRYKDPKSHIRLRIHISDENDISYVLIKQQIDELIRKKIIDFSIIDEYTPEITRYGGRQMIWEIEQMFVISSIISKEIIKYSYSNTMLREELYYILTIVLLKEIEKYIDVETLLNVYKKYYKRDKNVNLIRKIILEKYINNINSETFQLIENQTYMFINKLNELMPTITKIQNCNDILLSLFHMNYNRIMGINRNNENKTMGNIENIYYSLSSVLKRK